MVEKITKVTLYVENQEEAKKFWTEKMGFVITEEQDMGPISKWLEVAPLKEADTSFVLFPKKLMEQMDPHAYLGHPSIILSTSELEKTYEQLQEKDVFVDEIKQMPYGKMFTFQDNETNSYLIREDI